MTGAGVGGYVVPSSVRYMLPSSDAPDVPRTPAHLRARIQTCKQADPAAWELTRALVHPARLADTLGRLTERIQRSSLPGALREQLAAALDPSPAASGAAGDAALKVFTGLPHTKSLRALCLYFEIAGDAAPASTSASAPAPHDVEDVARQCASPYELLLRVEHPSLLDLGAGDLSFEEELLDRCLPSLRRRGTVFTLHALDRLRPGSRLGGRYHADPARLRRLAGLAPNHLRFRFWGDADMMSPSTPRELLSRYTIVTCHAPATPTFAYEPTRLSPAVIDAHLAATKGDARTVRVDGEEALTVTHRGERLTFPPWKFVIQGPLALLRLAARRGALCVLAAVDDEVFWELLAQLVDDPAMRPADVVFTPDTRRAVFGDVHRALTSLDVGARCSLADVTALRRAFPGPAADGTPAPHRFRFVEIRRGAVFPDVPASATARHFPHMREEAPPWHLTLVPEPAGA